MARAPFFRSTLVLETPGGPPPYATPSPMGPPGGLAPAKASGKAIASLVLGIIAICLSWIFLVNIVAVICGIVAVVLGVMANKDIDASGGGLTGKGMAIAGIIMGALGALIALLFLIFLATLMEDILREIENQTAEQIALLFR